MKIQDCIYFDHQASTPLFEEVFQEIEPFLKDACANPHSSEHALGWKSHEAVEKAATLTGQLIGADSDEIIFTSGATESNNLALMGLAKKAAISKSPRNRIIISAIEHKCVLRIGDVLKEQLGFKVDILPVDSEGQISIQDLDALMDEDVLAVSVMAVNNEIGSVQDIKAISGIAHQYGALFHCDAAQAPCAIDMQSITDHIDLISLSAHKMYGPKGIGALYVRHDLQDVIEPIIYGGGQQNGLRSGTLPTPLCVGMGAAAEILSSRQGHKLREELAEKTRLFYNRLVEFGCLITLNGPSLENRHPGNLNIRFEGFQAQDILAVVQPHLAASSGSACTSGITEPSHVLRAIGLDRNQAEESIRFSLGFQTSDEDITQAVELIEAAVSKLSPLTHRPSSAV